LWPPENKNFQFLDISLAHPPPNGKWVREKIAIDRELAYNGVNNKVAESLQGLWRMPVRTLYDFLAGFFCAKPNKTEVEMRITLQNERRKSNTKQSPRKTTSIETARIEGEGDSGQEVTVRYGTASQGKKSTFSWFEEFTVEWSETFIQKKQKKHRKGE
jgi:hypothetical protein